MNISTGIQWLLPTLCSFLLSVPAATAQDTVAVQLDLDQVLTATLAGNRELQAARLDEQVSLARYRETDALFLPRLDLSYTAFNSNNPLSAFGFKLQQQSITQQDFNPDLLNNPSGTADFTTKIELQQPLLSPDLLYQRKGAARQLESWQYRTLRTKEYLAYQAQLAYLRLQLAYEAVTLLESSLATVRALYTFTDNRYQKGLLQRSDVLNVQVQLAGVGTSLAKAKSNIANASDQLGLLMGKPGGIVYAPTSRLQPENGQLIAASGAVAAGRADLAALQKAIDAYDLMIRSAAMSHLPRLNAFASYQLNDNSMPGFGSNAYLVGAQLSWNLFNGNRNKNTIAGLRAEREKLQQQLSRQQEQSNVELQATNRAIADAQLEILQQKKAEEQASESLRVLQNRYRQGLVNTTDMLMATTQLSKQEFDLVQALFNLRAAEAYRQFLTTQP